MQRPIAGFLCNLVGLPAPFIHTFHFRVIAGVEEAPAGPGGQYDGDFWGLALAMADYASRFLEAHGMAQGNLYKLKDGEKRAIEAGQAYRVRVRMKDNTGRWGHWSNPVQFIPRLTATVSPGDIVITEFFANTAGADDNLEWFEFFNTTEHDLDITGWTIADNDTDRNPKLRLRLTLGPQTDTPRTLRGDSEQ